MGIETPEEFGGAGANFFTAILAVEELSRVDASVGVLSTCRTRSSTTPSSAGAHRAETEVPDANSPAESVGAYALSEPGSGSDAFAMQTRAVEKAITTC
jgi:alkylation response protein AidB-like acyl-CoA dehydrogenase